MQVIKFNSREEWLESRKQYIGASDAPIIMGVAKWRLPDGRIKTPYLLWRSKLGMEEIDTKTYNTEYGQMMEGPALIDYEEKTGIKFERNICVKNAEFPPLMVSLDGINLAENKLVEIKNINAEYHEMARNGIVPPIYIPQLQTQLLVTELDEMDYFSFHKKEGIIVKVKRDEKYIKKLYKKLEEFWKCIQELKEPELTVDDYIKQDLQWEVFARELYLIKKEKSNLCKKEKELEEKLKSLSNNKNACFGKYLYTKCISPGRVDYKSIPELVNVNLNDFRSNPIESWRLTKKEK